MSKFSLTITASPATLAAILSNLPADAVVADASPNVPAIPTGTGIPVAPALAPSVPTSAVPMPTAPTPIMSSNSTTSQDDDDEPGQAATGDTDSTGLRWDERIHAGTKTQTQKGEWKKRKGVDPAIVASVEAELRGAPPQPVAMTPIPVPTSMPIPSMPATPTPVEAPPPVAAPAPMVPAAPVAAPAADGAVDMMTLMSKIAGLSSGGIINAEYIAGLVARIAQASGEQITQITQVAGKQHLIDHAVAVMRADGIWS